MPRKAVLSAAQQAALVALPPTKHDLRLHYTLSENDLAIIRRKRGPHNRLGFAVQLCYLRFPGQAMTLEAEPSAEMLTHVAEQVLVHPNAWTEYAARDETRREYALELQSVISAVFDRRVPQGSRVVDGSCPTGGRLTKGEIKYDKQPPATPH
jgi:TnpA family transposase